MIQYLEASGGGMGAFSIIYLVAIFAVMYLLFLRPQRKEQKAQAARLSALEIGDSVRTSSGFFGTVIDISEDDATVIVEFGNNKNCRIPMLKEAIVEVEKPEDAIKPVEVTEDKKKKKKDRDKEKEKDKES